MHPSVSEAGRLLCAGTYLDSAYRDRVIEELYVHEERIVAPSYGFDAARVLAHALRARRTELGWAAAVLGAWFAGSLLTSGALAMLLFPFLLLSLADWLGNRGGAAFRFLSLLVRVYGWWTLLVVLLSITGTLLALLDDDTLGPAFTLGPLLFGQALGAPSRASPWCGCRPSSPPWSPSSDSSAGTSRGPSRATSARAGTPTRPPTPPRRTPAYGSPGSAGASAPSSTRR